MNIRNIAIIAHVDHGKTTLVDGMLKQTHTFRDNEAEMTQTTILDSNALEREKGITILAKNTAVIYKNTKINIIDTPGHADFSGEVERTINMADGALLIVDAAEGPLPQTQFVLQKALERNLPIIVVINKIDRKDARPKEVLHQTEELFLHIAHHEDHLNFPVLYAIGREEKAWDAYPTNMHDPATLEPLFETILSYLPAPQTDADKPFKMLVSTLDFDSYKGTYAIGKVTQGTIKPGQSVVLLNENEMAGSHRVEGVFESVGLKRVSTLHSQPGDIIAITGIPDVAIGQTIADPSDPTGYPTIKLEAPTLKILLSANTSPFAGREGKFCTARQIYQRLIKEKQTNIGLKINENPDGTGFIVAGRGELHLAVLLENLRREGYEMQVAKPEVILKEIDGVKSEPFEEITIEIDNAFVGVVTEELGRRRAELLDTHTNERGVTKMVYKVSSRNLLGFRGDILTKTRGNGLFATRFIGYFPVAAHIAKLRNGVLVASESGKSTGYALTTVQERGKSFIGPGIPVYEGMVIGVNNRQEDIDINVCKIKKLTNIHSANADVAIQLDPPTVLSLEQCLDFVEEDELLEITPLSLRLRKKHLTKVARARANRT
ncbi:GTP-binding protein TypA [Candidatus Gottesmanbacteria bacterium RIFCSPLOWO2_01_FULL_48_11]|uniref:50S ribosomal subunit assembly factor BipA n=2 Tax=Candidatus Gottesmaniibacteriota TaxID=1752720 RepID=A0A0G1U1B2_9BACT|nr:MAG: GTP-binding protein TypA [Candidatus Gottesmanbacteria bacterium GW2011_GWA2_47_9]OGG28381.1 MAG: GTP-binding protein TypA [Candidatus Gottesmanbacteria bacterium RIFCSPLOWO2_01_FULL_48_11]